MTPHLAGTEAAHQTARHIKRLWEKHGLTGVKMLPYTVMLSYPDKDNPNRIVLHNGKGQVVHTSQLVEKILRPEQNHSDVVPPFNAFSAPGTPQVDVITISPSTLFEGSMLSVGMCILLRLLCLNIA